MASKILIVEDITEYQDLYNDLFADSIQKKWYSIKYAVTGEEALELIKKDRKQEIALIVLDLRLENALIDGVALANVLAENHIDKKIIIWTGFPQWKTGFTEEAEKNIIKLIKRTEYPHEFLKDLCDIFMIGNQFEVPGSQAIDKDSKLLGYPTIRKLVKTLPSEFRYQLIEEILPFFPVYMLLDMEKTLPSKIRKILEEATERDTLKQWIIKKQQAGFFSDIPPAAEVDDFMIEIVEKIKKKTGRYYEDFFLRGSHYGKRFSRYIAKDLVKELPPEFRQRNGAKVIYKSAPREI
ncbi:MAG: response regulator [Crocosphaera sp.]|nr:response regulator [Crocosphaera sp.]